MALFSLLYSIVLYCLPLDCKALCKPLTLYKFCIIKLCYSIKYKVKVDVTNIWHVFPALSLMFFYLQYHLFTLSWAPGTHTV